MGKSPSSAFAMQCPHCPARLRVTEADLGTERSCPRCGQRITIARPQPRHSDPAQQARSEFGIRCKLCGTLFYATHDQIGQTIDCPDCLTEHLVAAPVVPPVRKPIFTSPADVDEYQLRPLEPAVESPGNLSPSRVDPEMIYIRCRVCGTVLGAPPDRVGQTVSCHDCGTRNLVEPPPARPPKPRVVAVDPHIGIDEPADLEVNRRNADKTMREAHAHEAEQARKLPRPPTRPFTECIYGFPFLPRIIPVWVCMAPMLLAITIMYGAAAQAEGLEMFGAIGLSVAATVMSLVLLLTFGFYMMQVIQTTAVGYREPEEWPRFDFGEALGSAVYLVVAFLLSVLPVLLAARWLPPLVTTIGMAICGFVFYPVILMSMLNDASPASPLTQHVIRTLQAGRGIWLQFYAATAALGLPVAGLLWGSTYLGVAGSVLNAVVLALGVVIYFRLLGRLAWALDQLPLRQASEDDASDEKE